MDITPYKDVDVSNEESRFHPGILNFFNAKRRLDPSDVQGRLKRIHGVLKKAWYIDEPTNTIDHIIDVKKGQAVEMEVECEIENEDVQDPLIEKAQEVTLL